MSKEKKQYFSLEGMHCASCANTITKEIKKINNIESVSVSFVNKIATVTGSVNQKDVLKAVENSGYTARPTEHLTKIKKEEEKERKKEYHQKVLQSTIFLISGFTILAFPFFGGSIRINSLNSQIIWAIIGFFSLFIMLFFGKNIYKQAFLLAKKLNSNMNTLIALGTLTAWLYSIFVVFFPNFFPEESRYIYFESSLIILGMVTLGQALDLKIRGKTSQAIYRLLQLRNKTAQVIRNGKNLTIKLEEVNISDKIRVNSGESIPVDGIIKEGLGEIDESMLTGESIIVQKNKGASVFAGTLNVGQSFIMEATKVGNQTKLAQITKLVANAQNSKPPIGLLADKIVSIFVPVMILISFLTGIIWFFSGAEVNHILITAVSVIIIACPCALGLATPISTIIGMGKSAEYGGLIRNGESLQKASKIDTVVLDKTGTLTEGKPSVKNVFFLNEEKKEKISNFIYSLEKSSNHPIAKSLVNFTSKLQTKTIKFTKTEEVHGKGLKALYKEEKIFLGNLNFIKTQKIKIENKKIDDFIQSQKYFASTLVFFALNNKIEAVFSITDKIRFDTKQALQSLKKMNIKTIMLTGDNEKTASSVANELGILEWKANYLPEDKLNYVKKLQEKGNFVAVVGDGVNDSPALTISDVGFAIGGGTDIAIESSDVALLNPSLNGISNIINISKQTIRNIKQNLFGAFIYNIVGIPIAAGILYPFFGFLLSPIIASTAMALSSITVITNANRLRFLNFKKNK